jgi:hypothetical protein
MIMVNRKKQWHELTESQQVAIVILSVVQFGLLVAALWDIYHRPANKVNGSKLAWTLGSFINYVGPIAYFTFGRK